MLKTDAWHCLYWHTNFSSVWQSKWAELLYLGTSEIKDFCWSGMELPKLGQVLFIVTAEKVWGVLCWDCHYSYHVSGKARQLLMTTSDRGESAGPNNAFNKIRVVIIPPSAGSATVPWWCAAKTCGASWPSLLAFQGCMTLPHWTVSAEVLSEESTCVPELPLLVIL